VKKSTRILIPLAVILGSVLFAMVLVLSRPDVETVAPEATRKWIRTVEVRREPVQMRIASQGSVAPRTETNLVAEVAGRVTRVSPSFVAGGFFDEGDVLVWIDDRDYQASLSQAHSQVAQAEVKLQKTEREGHLARREWQKHNTGEMPALVTYEPQIAEALAGLDATRAALGKAELDMERTRIRAPYTGRVRVKGADVGRYLTPGMNIGTIYAVDYVEVRLPLPDHELAFLGIPFDFSSHRAGRPGPEVILRSRFAGQELERRGHITRLEGEIDARSRMVYAVARVEDPYDYRSGKERPPLAVGMFVEAEILGDRTEAFFVIPRSALRDSNYVLVVTPDSTLRFRTVEVARVASGLAYVRSGLTDGEQVCVSPVPIAVDGMPVRIFEDSSSAPARSTRTDTP